MSKAGLERVEDLLAHLDHPQMPLIRALRALVLGVDAGVTEEVKWKSPSFKTTEHFATMQLRATDRVQLILHFGAKKRDVSAVSVPDPEGLLTWLGADRATVVLHDMEELEARRNALVDVLKAWLPHV